VRPDGSVASVEVAKSAGHRILDQSAIAGFQNWRFKPRAVTHVKIPMDFTMAGLRPQGIDSALQAEKRGSQPPPGYVSWRAYWSECERLWTGYHHSIGEQIDVKRAADAACSQIAPLWDLRVWRYLPADPAHTLNSPVASDDDLFLTPDYLKVSARQLDYQLKLSEQASRDLLH